MNVEIILIINFLINCGELEVLALTVGQCCTIKVMVLVDKSYILSLDFCHNYHNWVLIEEHLNHNIIRKTWS